MATQLNDRDAQGNDDAGRKRGGLSSGASMARGLCYGAAGGTVMWSGLALLLRAYV